MENTEPFYILLKELFEKGLECRTIETHRPVISVLHDRISNHPRVSALMSGIFNKRPPKPKYTFVWDVEAFRFSKEASRK